ncbi:hypothetical protein AAVH_43280, partial [Aphelenchoides avenae]
MYADEKLDESFFVPAAQRGVRSVCMWSAADEDTPAKTAAALSFGFAEPSAGGDRSLYNIDCDDGTGFLAQVKQ